LLKVLTYSKNTALGQLRQLIQLFALDEPSPRYPHSPS